MGRQHSWAYGWVRYLVVILSIISSSSTRRREKDPDYKDALSKSIIFFEGQRSGKLPSNQTIRWRSDSGLSHGSPEHVDLVGGYYDAGDNIKFGLPMAFTTTMLAWSVLEFFGRKKMMMMLEEERLMAHEAVRWATDYLLKASAHLPQALYVQVGDPVADHKCWVRPEDMEMEAATPSTVYKVTPSDPGSDVAAETAAALAASSLLFSSKTHPAGSDHYSNALLHAAEKAFHFANSYRAKYSDSPLLHPAVCPFYCSYSGYLDELQWAAAWLYRATKNSSYLQYAISTAVEDDCDTFSWDNKLPGTRILLSQYSFGADAGDKSTARFNEEAKRYICSVLPNLQSTTVQYTAGGLMFKMNATNLQYVTASTFLFTVYAKYLKTSKQTFSCGSKVITPSLLRRHAKRQINYILGDNPKGMSYMVGYGEKYPQRIHHRGSSLPSLQQKSEPFGCGDAFQSYYYTSEPNPNILIGAVVGGPNHEDEFYDDRDNYAQSEPATYINAPLVGSLASLASTSGS